MGTFTRAVDRAYQEMLVMVDGEAILSASNFPGQDQGDSVCVRLPGQGSGRCRGRSRDRSDGG